MTSPKARRRQRSTRLVTAVTLLVIAAALVTWGVLDNVPGLLAGSAVVAVLLGAAATRITHSELMESRREAGRDRARLAKEYVALDASRVAEHAEAAGHLTTRLADRESALHELEEALVAAQRRAAEATRKRNAEARRADLAEQEGSELTRRLEDAEERAAEAIVRVAELEAEVEVLQAEIIAWQGVASQESKLA
jgi:chromosome segregation ATPase